MFKRRDERQRVSIYIPKVITLKHMNEPDLTHRKYAYQEDFRDTYVITDLDTDLKHCHSKDNVFASKK